MIRKIIHRSREFSKLGDGRQVSHFLISCDGVPHYVQKVWMDGKVETYGKSTYNAISDLIQAGTYIETPIFPIYYTHVNAFGDNTAYLVANSENDITLVRNDGSSKKTIYYKHSDLQKFAKVGLWKVITEDEAKSMIAVPDRYFTCKGSFGDGSLAAILTDNETKLMILFKNGEVGNFGFASEGIIARIKSKSIFAVWDEISKSQYEEIVKAAKNPPKFREEKCVVTSFSDPKSQKSYKVTTTTLIEEQ